MNPTEDISTSGSGHSAWFAWHSEHNILDGQSRVFLMDADILYEPSLIERVLHSPSTQSKTLVCSEYRHTHEEVMVFSAPNQPQQPLYHGKGLLGTPLVDGCECLGEATGILLFEAADHAMLKQVTDWVIKYSTAKARSEHEDLTQRMMLLHRMAVVQFGKDNEFMECDTPEEYEVLIKEMYPRLKGRFSLTANE